MNNLKTLAEQCMLKFKEGQLKESDLQELAECAVSRPQRQQLLYLQASTTSVMSEVLGMAFYSEGRLLDAPEGKPDWPYKNVAQAVHDGWRVIKFPEMALLLDSNRTYGLGCEFILEKWS